MITCNTKLLNCFFLTGLILSLYTIHCGDESGKPAVLTNNNQSNSNNNNNINNNQGSDCQQDGDCDNGIFCDGKDVCVNGQCQVLEETVCNDQIDCTEDTCDEANKTCSRLPNHALCFEANFPLCSAEQGCVQVSCVGDADCDDAFFCNGNEVCSNDACQAGKAPFLNDNVDCTDDICDEDRDVVVHTANHSLCSDNIFCNGQEICEPTDGCKPGTALDPDDGIDCTIDSCDESGDQILNTPDHTQCADDLFCNGAETCEPGVGCKTNPVLNLDDGLACTIDKCNEATDQIAHTPDHSMCDDKLYCNGLEQCNITEGCEPGTPPIEDDGIACTIETCDEENQTVSLVKDDSVCDDGLFCNGEEFCDASLDCQSAKAPLIDDKITCTIDLCDENLDKVTNTPDDALCSDQIICNGQETCHQTMGCQKAVNLIAGSSCENTYFCVTGEQCDGNGICDVSQGTAIDCTNNDPCLKSVCDETIDDCHTEQKTWTIAAIISWLQSDCANCSDCNGGDNWTSVACGDGILVPEAQFHNCETIYLECEFNNAAQVRARAGDGNNDWNLGTWVEPGNCSDISYTNAETGTGSITCCSSS